MYVNFGIGTTLLYFTLLYRKPLSVVGACACLWTLVAVAIAVAIAVAVAVAVSVTAVAVAVAVFNIVVVPPAPAALAAPVAVIWLLGTPGALMTELISASMRIYLV